MNHFNTKKARLHVQWILQIHQSQLTNTLQIFSLNNEYQSNKQIDYFNEPDKNQEKERRNIFTNRSEINIRQNYIFKVLGDKNSQSIRSLKQQNVFIFDWDDTLLCTNYISSNKITSIQTQYQQIFKSIDSLSFKIIKSSLQKGMIFIISNSSQNWLSYSSKKYMPKTNQIIWTHPGIKIISARDNFQQKYPQNVLKWKVQSFKIIKKHVNIYTITNMICIGDSQDQMIASELLAKDFKQIYLKKIKLQPRPTPQELLKQLQTLDKKFQDVYSAVISTSIKLAKKILSQEKSCWNNKDKINKKWLCKQY